jgi:moderate conductance mechanosensitive channel
MIFRPTPPSGCVSTDRTLGPARRGGLASPRATMAAMPLAIVPLTDFTDWARGSGLEIVLYLTGAVLLARATNWTGTRITKRIDANSAGDDQLIRSEQAKHGHVLTQVITWVVVVLIFCVAGVLVLQRLNVPLTGLVAPAAVVGVALGFGAQRLVQDLLAGLFIIIERQYGFGDVIRVATLGAETGVTGTVEQVTLRVTRMRTLNGEVVIVPNGQLVQVTNMSRDWARAVIDVPVPSTADIHDVREVLQKVGQALYDDEQWRPLMLDAPTVLGVEALEVDSLHVRIVARTLPGKQFEIGRELRSRVATALRDEGIILTTGLDTADPVATT